MGFSPVQKGAILLAFCAWIEESAKSAMSWVQRTSLGKCIARVFLGLGLGVSLLAAGCGGSTPTVITVTVAPATAYVPVLDTLQFNATVTGTTNAAVVWSVNNYVGGNFPVGFVSQTGYYQAPSSVPSPTQVTVTATSQQDDTKSASATVTIVAQSASANIVQVASGQTTSNISLQLLPLTPTLSIYGAGTCNGSSCSTSPTGAQMAQGSSATIFVVGQGIVSGTVYSVSGNPADVTVTQPSGSQFGQTKDGTPSVTFDVQVSATAVPGVRNIMVSNPITGELSAFVGGILITPSGQ